MQKLDHLQQWIDSEELTVALGRRKLGQEFDSLISVLNQSEEDLRGIDDIKKASNLASDKDIDRTTIIRESNRLVTAARLLKNASSADEIREWRRNQWDVVIDSGKAILDLLRDIWNARCEKAFSEHKQLGEILKRFESTSDLGNQMVSVANNGLALKHTFPPGKGDYNKFNNMINNRNNQREKLAKIGGTEGVSQLLLKAADKSATLEDLTEETWKWLKNQGAAEIFRLVLE